MKKLFISAVPLSLLYHSEMRTVRRIRNINYATFTEPRDCTIRQVLLPRSLRESVW